MDPAAIVVALSGLVTAMGGIYLSRRGQADTQRQEQAAVRVAEQGQKLDASRLAIEAMESVNTMQRRELDRQHELLQQAELREQQYVLNAVIYRTAVTDLVEAVRSLVDHLAADDPVALAAKATIEDVIDNLPRGGSDGGNPE